MEKKIIITIISIIILSISLSGCVQNNEIASLSLDEIPPIILFIKEGNSLMVITADKGLEWDNVTITSGSCELPTGSIIAGDTINNCKGTLVLSWIPSNTVIGKWKF